MFISNPTKTVAMCAQRAGEPPAGVLVWDYHVVTLTKLNDVWTVLDPDHIPSAAVSLSNYLGSSFEPLNAVPSQYLPQFKLVEASYLKAHFASDRRHMRSVDGEWLKAPPPWTCIGSGHNLDEFIDMENSQHATAIGLSSLRAAEFLESL